MLIKYYKIRICGGYYLMWKKKYINGYIGLIFSCRIFGVFGIFLVVIVKD